MPTDMLFDDPTTTLLHDLIHLDYDQPSKFHAVDPYMIPSLAKLVLTGHAETIELHGTTYARINQREYFGSFKAEMEHVLKVCELLSSAYTSYPGSGLWIELTDPNLAYEALHIAAATNSLYEVRERPGVVEARIRPVSLPSA